MLSVSSEVKTLYKANNTHKSYSIYFPLINLNVNEAGKNNKIPNGSFSMEEGICSDNDLKFGACEASEIRFTVADIEQDLTGLEFTISQSIEANIIPFGTYIVKSCKKQEDKRFKDIVAYNKMTLVDTDVTTWYNSLAFPMTLSAFRASFLTYVDLTQDTSKLPLPNDSMTVTKTIEPASLSGRMVIEAIEEINGVFGHINRSGQFTHIILKPAYGLYPSIDLYPSDTLYPASETDTTYVRSDLIDETITESMRKSIRFEEYAVKEIDKLVIRTDEEDYGAIVGTGTNAYIIQGNFLVYGKSASELQTIATNAFGYMAKRPYRPYESDNIGLPYLEPGDVVKFDQTEPVVGYMLNRTLTGIQSLRDEYGASGNQEREQRTDVNTEVKILQRKTLTIQKDVDGVRIEVTDLGANLSTEITTLAGEVSIKVSKAEIIQTINLSTEGLKVDVTKLDINGIVTANNNFKILLDGSMEAVNGKFQGQITGGSININGNFIVNADGTMSATGANINGSLTNTGASGTVTINNGLIVTTALRSTYIGNDGSRVSQLHVNTIYLDGEIFDPGLITTLYARGGGIDSPRNVYLDSSQNLVPSTTSYDFGLGSSGLPWTSLRVKNIYHSGGGLGFYGATPTSKTSISTLSSSATLANVIDKINSMINNSHGMW